MLSSNVTRLPRLVAVGQGFRGWEADNEGYTASKNHQVRVVTMVRGIFSWIGRNRIITC